MGAGDVLVPADLAAMNLLLLKKVEELTLHLIEKEKQLEKQGKVLAESIEEISRIRACVRMD